MYEDIRRNKLKTALIVGIFILVITLIVYYVCMAFDLGVFSIVIALLVSILSAWSSYYYSDKIILSFGIRQSIFKSGSFHAIPPSLCGA